MQLTKFLGINTSAKWQPYVVSYYAELTTLCLQDSLTSGEEFVPLLTECLCSAVYDIRLASLQFLAGVFDGKISDDKVADDYDDADGNNSGSDFSPVDASSQSSAERRQQLSKLLADASSDLLQLFIDMLMSRETHDECLLVVSSVILVC